jgi:hypothetical protein
MTKSPTTLIEEMKKIEEGLWYAASIDYSTENAMANESSPQEMVHELLLSFATKLVESIDDIVGNPDINRQTVRSRLAEMLEVIKEVK